MDKAKISITANYTITKYDVGKKPGIDKPMEVIHRQEVLTGDDTINFIKQMGGEVNATH